MKLFKIRSSNIHYIRSLSKNSFFEILDGGILRDKDEKLFKKLVNKVFKKKIDIIITNGAVSAGKFDFVPKIVKNLSELKPTTS